MAELYERARPGYPAEATDWLVERLALAPGQVAVDLAAGTGKLTRQLVPSGARVVAVEPLAEMRAQLEGEVPGAEVVDGTAEELPLGPASADAVTVGQAFHWFDARRAAAEIARVLRPGGALALVWNIRDLSDPLQQRLDALLRPSRGETPSEHEQPWRDVLDESPWFGTVEERSFAFVQQQTTDELADRIASISFVAQLEPAPREALLDRVRAEVAGLPQPFAFRYRTDVFVYPRL